MVTPPNFFWSKNHESFGFAFGFSAEKVFSGPDFVAFVWGGVGRALMQFMPFSAIFGMLAVLATPVLPWYPL